MGAWGVMHKFYLVSDFTGTFYFPTMLDLFKIWFGVVGVTVWMQLARVLNIEVRVTI